MAIECRLCAGKEKGSDRRPPLASKEELIVRECVRGEKLSEQCSSAGVGSNACVGDETRPAI